MRVFIINQVEFSEDEAHDPGTRVGLEAIKGYRSLDTASTERRRMDERKKLVENPFYWSASYPFVEDQLSDIRDLDGMGEYTLESVEDLQSVLDDSYSGLPESTRLELWRMSDFRDDMFYSLTEIEIEDCRTLARAI